MDLLTLTAFTTGCCTRLGLHLSGVACCGASFLWRLLFLALLVAAGNIAAAEPDARENLEAEIKAAMLYKFLDYIEWPPHAFPEEDTPYRIAFAEAERVFREVEQIAARRQVKGRAIEVRELNGMGSLAGTHVLFIGEDTFLDPDWVMDQAQEHAVLTVTEEPEGLQPHSLINLRTQNDRVAFDISLVMSELSNLKLSARLLAVASSVKKAR